jgi:homocysteine S-methyltransferase
MKMGLLEDLQSKILIGDGAMGTLLHAHGIDNCFEELNITKPEDIFNIHKAYQKAGASVIQTNTYGANFPKLKRYGAEEKVKDINIEGVRLAKKAVGDSGYVLGTIGGIRSFQKSIISLEEIKRSFREQLFWLLSEDVDGLLFETFYDLEELKTVLEIARRETDKPIVTNVSLHEKGVLQDGTPIVKALKILEELGADVVGTNCRQGPYHMLEILEEVPLLDKSFLSAYPNASLPQYVDGRLIYETDPDYFYKTALAFKDQGVRLLGGCCGTTPSHIEAMAKALTNAVPITEKTVKEAPPIEVLSQEIQAQPHLHEIVQENHSIIVELDPPKKLGVDKFLKGAHALQTAGIDALTLADNSLASPRISNLAMASLLKDQLKTRPLIHLTCRDRNLIGLQSHLMGMHTLGFNQILALTGDPSKIGDFPGATSVYDLSSFDLIRLIKQFNEGVSFSGKPLGQKTNFSIAGAFNPNVRHLDRAVQRLEKKVDCGADYFISQPIYSIEQLEDVYKATKSLKAPIYIGIMPLTGAKNARFLHHEVPGIKLSENILTRMERIEHDKEQSAKEGILLAKELIDRAYELFNGLYLITPFMRYEMTVELANYIKAKELVSIERKI